MKRLIYLLLLLCCVANSEAQPAQQTVQGRVVYAEVGQPAGGIVIKARQSGSHTVTMADGSFTIQCNTDRDTLDISSKGYRPVVMAIGTGTQLPLLFELMPLNRDLEMVTVNTGYQKIGRERATGSYTQLGKELLNQQTGTTIVDRLETISNGLYFDRQTNTGTAPRIIIRGLSTIKGPSGPLIVVDDFPYEGNLDNINPNDVESITILKDAAAASIWGTRAGNGVIVITTKRGRFNQPVKVEFASSVLISRPPDLGYIKQVSAPELVALESFLYGKGYYSSTLAAQPYLYTTPVIETLLQRDRGMITAAAANEQLAAIAQHNVLDDFKKYVYRNGVNFQNSLSANGGTKNMAWTISAGYDRNDDVLGARYDRYKLRDGHLFKISKRLELSIGLDYTQSEAKTGQQSYTTLKPNQGMLPVYTRLADDNGNPLAVNYKYRQAYTDTAGRGGLLDWKWYPLAEQDNIDSRSRVQAVLADIGLQYKLTPAIALSLKYQYGKQVSSGETVYGTGSYFTRNLINQYSAVSSTGKISYNIPMGAIVDRDYGNLRTDNVRAQVSFNKTFKVHRIDAIAGGELRQAVNTKWAYRTYGFNENNLRAVAVDYVTKFADFLSGSTNVIPDGGNNSGTVNRNLSLYANAAYTYRAKYTISGSARRDASNLFGVLENDRWTPLWSAGASWDIAKENFYKLKLLPALKIRISHGVSGNADPLRSAVSVIQYNSTNSNTQTPIAIVSQFANPELKWEQVRMTNVGIDFSSRGNRLSGSVEYYYKKATDLFGTTPVDYTAVAAISLTKNVATIAGHGWDIDLSSRNTIRTVLWSTHLNLNFNKDKVLEYYLVSRQGSNFVQGNNVSANEGKPVYALYNYRWMGLDPATGDPQGWLNGAVSKNYTSITGSGTQLGDLVYMGPTLPTVVVSLANTIGWRNISVTFNIAGKFGNYFQRSSVDYTQLIGFRNGHTDYSQRWQQPGDEANTNVPSLVYPNNTQRNVFYSSSEVLATKGDFIKLRYVTVSYTLKKPAVQFYVNANNLGILWRANKYGIDPEYLGNLPASPNYAFGLRATF